MRSGKSTRKRSGAFRKCEADKDHVEADKAHVEAKPLIDQLILLVSNFRNLQLLYKFKTNNVINKSNNFLLDLII